jgi:hypothetical protein
MSGIEEVAAAPTHRRLLAVLGVAVVLFLGLWMTRGPVGEAIATESGFCTEVWLQPFGQNGDRCDAGKDNWGHIITVWVVTHQRAGCANYTGWYGELYKSWWCVPKESSGYIRVPQDGGSYIGIIRNNNLSYAGKFSGKFSCCYAY